MAAASPAQMLATLREDAGSFGSGTITHRLALRDAAELDDEVRGHLRAAYDARG